MTAPLLAARGITGLAMVVEVPEPRFIGLI